MTNLVLLLTCDMSPEVILPLPKATERKNHYRQTREGPDDEAEDGLEKTQWRKGTDVIPGFLFGKIWICLVPVTFSTQVLM